MNDTQSPLKITYTGERARVDPTRITEDMYVPNIGTNDDLIVDDLPGASAASLFREAEGEGALIAPDGIVPACYSRDTYLTHDFMLVISPPGEDQTGITQGWFDVEMLAREAGDARSDNDPGVVREALEIMAAKINAALIGE